MERNVFQINLEPLWSDIVKKSKIYRIDEVGSIMCKIKNNNLKIETFES